jgi:hypothetical protein
MCEFLLEYFNEIGRFALTMCQSWENTAKRLKPHQGIVIANTWVERRLSIERRPWPGWLNSDEFCVSWQAGAKIASSCPHTRMWIFMRGLRLVVLPYCTSSLSPASIAQIGSECTANDLILGVRGKPFLTWLHRRLVSWKQLLFPIDLASFHISHALLHVF